MAITETRPEAATDVDAAVDAEALTTSPNTVFGSGDHLTLGRLWIGAALLFGVAGWVVTALVGVHEVGDDLFTAQAASTMFTLGRLGLVLLVVVPLLLGILTFIVPLQVGANTVAFPRAASLAFWTWLLSGGVLIVANAIDGGFGGGRREAVDLMLVSLLGVVAALVLGTICVLTTAITLAHAGHVARPRALHHVGRPRRRLRLGAQPPGAGRQPRAGLRRPSVRSPQRLRRRGQPVRPDLLGGRPTADLRLHRPGPGHRHRPAHHPRRHPPGQSGVRARRHRRLRRTGLRRLRPAVLLPGRRRPRRVGRVLPPHRPPDAAPRRRLGEHAARRSPAGQGRGGSGRAVRPGAAARGRGRGALRHHPPRVA